LSVKTMDKLAFVMYNRKLRERHFKKLTLKDDEEPLVQDAPLSDNEWVEDDGADLSGEEGAGGDDDAIRGVELEPEGEGATQGGEPATQRGEPATQRGEVATQRGEAVTRRAPKTTYLRKRKTTSKAAMARGCFMFTTYIFNHCLTYHTNIE
jgi:hypothetical protein